MRPLSITERADPGQRRVPPGAREGARRDRRSRGDRRAESRARSSANILACMLRRLDVMIPATEAGDTRPVPRLRVGRRAHRRSQADRGDLIGASQPAIAATVVRAGPAGSGVLPLQHCAPRCPREHDQAQRSTRRSLAGDGRRDGGDPPAGAIGRVARVDRRRSCHGR